MTVEGILLRYAIIVVVVAAVYPALGVLYYKRRALPALILVAAGAFVGGVAGLVVTGPSFHPPEATVVVTVTCAAAGSVGTVGAVRVCERLFEVSQTNR
jgi:hypothetical protein